MKVFIAGATGDLGTAVAARLLKGGHDVTGLARSDISAERLRAAGIRPVSGDLADPVSLALAAGGAEAVVHLAQPSVTPGTDMRSVLGDFGRLQVDAVSSCLRVLPTGARLIFTSGAGGYGDTGSGVATEQTPVVSNPAMAGLAEAERLVESPAAEPFVTQRQVVDAVAAAAGLGAAQQPPAGIAAALAAGPGIFSRTMRVTAPRSLALGWRPRAVDLGAVASDLGHMQDA